MPRTSFQNRVIRDKRSSEILDAALYLFSTKSYEKVSIDMIADECKISHGLFYHYFKSKEQIVDSLNEQFISSIENSLLHVIRETDTGEVFLKKLLRIFLNNIYSNDKNNYHTKLFLDNTLIKLNENADQIIFTPKIDKMFTNSIKEIKKQTTNISQKEFDQFLYLFLNLLSTLCDAKNNYSRLFKLDINADSLFTLIMVGLIGSSDNQHIG